MGAGLRCAGKCPALTTCDCNHPNIYSLALRGDPAVTAVLREVSRIGITAISVGELLSGFKAGSRAPENRRELGRFLDSPRGRLYPVDANTAEYYSAILSQLRKQGSSLPTNDIWIAAAAFQHGLQLYSMDAHFAKAAGLLRR